MSSFPPERTDDSAEDSPSVKREQPTQKHDDVRPDAMSDLRLSLWTDMKEKSWLYKNDTITSTGLHDLELTGLQTSTEKKTAGDMRQESREPSDAYGKPIPGAEAGDTPSKPNPAARAGDDPGKSTSALKAGDDLRKPTGDKLDRKIDPDSRDRDGRKTDGAGLIHGRSDVGKLVPDHMKYGAAWNPWERLTPPEKATLVNSMATLSKEMVNREAARTESSPIGPRRFDAEGRLISAEETAKNRRLHFTYDGKTKDVAAVTIENTRTGKTVTMLPVQDGPSISKDGREWISVNSKGESRFWRGGVTTDREGRHSIRLKADASESGAGRKIDGLRTDDRKIEPRPGTDRTGSSPAKQDLHRAAERFITNPIERREYLRNIDRFEAAAKRSGHSSKEVADFYTESARLLSTPSRFVNQADRVKIAHDALKQAIKPTSIEQGPHNTCNVATIEVCMYSRNPSKAIKAVADAALTGSFRAADGSRITVPDATLRRPPAGGRSFASQIFQEVAANVHWQRADRAPDGSRVRPGDLRYSHGFKRSFDHDTGQRMWRASDGRAILERRTGLPMNHPSLDITRFPGIYRQIAGSSPETLAIGHERAAGRAAGVRTISSERDLHQELSRLSRGEKGFPVILKVHTGHEPWRTDSGYGRAGGSGGWHVVTVTGYDPVTRRATVDNTWSQSKDHTGLPGQLPPIHLSQLYRSMPAAPHRTRR